MSFSERPDIPITPIISQKSSVYNAKRKLPFKQPFSSTPFARLITKEIRKDEKLVAGVDVVNQLGPNKSTAPLSLKDQNKKLLPKVQTALQDVITTQEKSGAAQPRTSSKSDALEVSGLTARSSKSGSDTATTKQTKNVEFEKGVAVTKKDLNLKHTINNEKAVDQVNRGTEKDKRITKNVPQPSANVVPKKTNLLRRDEKGSVNSKTLTSALQNLPSSRPSRIKSGGDAAAKSRSNSSEKTISSGTNFGPATSRTVAISKSREKTNSTGTNFGVATSQTETRSKSREKTSSTGTNVGPATSQMVARSKSREKISSTTATTSRKVVATKKSVERAHPRIVSDELAVQSRVTSSVQSEQSGISNRHSGTSGRHSAAASKHTRTLTTRTTSSASVFDLDKSAVTIHVSQKRNSVKPKSVKRKANDDIENQENAEGQNGNRFFKHKKFKTEKILPNSSEAKALKKAQAANRRRAEKGKPYDLKVKPERLRRWKAVAEPTSKIVIDAFEQSFTENFRMQRINATEEMKFFTELEKRIQAELGNVKIPGQTQPVNYLAVTSQLATLERSLDDTLTGVDHMTKLIETVKKSNEHLSAKKEQFESE